MKLSNSKIFFQSIFERECSALDNALDGIYADPKMKSSDAATQTLTLGKISAKSVQEVQRTKKRGKIIGSVGDDWEKIDQNWPGVVLKKAEESNLKRNVPKILDKSSISLFRLGGRYLQIA